MKYKTSDLSSFLAAQLNCASPVEALTDTESSGSWANLGNSGKR